MTFRFPRRWQDGDTGLNPLSETLERRRAAGLPLFDLTVSNPSQCGLKFPEDWQELLGGRAVRTYDPDPRGNAAARAAIAAYYDERNTAGEGADGGAVDSTDIFLTAGTSEGYSHLFKLLCEPGDHALIPRPSYPLLETLAELENISLDSYELLPGDPTSEETPWRLNRAGLEGTLTSRTRILFVVHPNNPTGSLMSPEDAGWLLELAERRGLALVIDEVFADYIKCNESTQKSAPMIRPGATGPLVFTLNGLSKLLGLPQLKLAWIHVAGNREDKERAARHLEWICDAYLSVGTAPQAACAELLRRHAEFQGPIRERIAENRAALGQVAGTVKALSPLWPEGGWCVPVRCAGITDDESFAIELLKSEGVHVHPGYFFDFDSEDVIILSLLTPPDIFQEGLSRIAQCLTHTLKH